jgi:hypothetical protein
VPFEILVPRRLEVLDVIDNDADAASSALHVSGQGVGAREASCGTAVASSHLM